MRSWQRWPGVAVVVLVLAACGVSTAKGATGSTGAVASAARRPPTTPARTVPATRAVAPAAAPVVPGHIILVGDSVMAALNPNYTNAAQKILGAARWRVTIDAKVNRSTIEGRAVLARLQPAATDTVVIMLGHNDAGTPSVFRPRVEAILSELAGVRRVFWLTMAEPRYASADAVLASEQATFKNLRLIPWAQSIQPGWTAHDGLHVNPPGARGMAELILRSVSAP